MRERLESYTHFNMSFIGGFFGGFAILNFCDLFGNAQTANMINIFIDIVGGNFFSVLLRVIGLLIYFISLALSVVIPKYTKINVKYLSLVFNLLAVFLIALMPKNLNLIFYIYPIFFVMPFQWSVFCGANGFNSSSIFSTNNFRQFSISFVDYLCTKNEKSIVKAKFFGKTLLSYHMGVFVSALGVALMGINSIFILLVPILTATVLVYIHSEKSISRNISVETQ